MNIKTTDEIVGGVLNNLAHLQDLVDSIQKLTTTYNTLKYKVENLENELAKKRQELHEKESWANLGKLSTFIAHELRSPISAILLYIDYLRSHISPKQKIENNTANHLLEAISNIEVAADSINGFITDLLNVSRDFKLSFQSITIDEIINNLQTKINVLLKPKNNVKTIFNKDENFTISIDKKYFVQALFNLIKNAIESTQNHLPVNHIQISFLKYDTNFCCEIKDTGSGIPDSIKENLFTPFYTAKKNGIGLGLAFTKKIINAHNGSIELKYTGPAGTCFLITIPNPQLSITNCHA